MGTFGRLSGCGAKRLVGPAAAPLRCVGIELKIRFCARQCLILAGGVQRVRLR